MNFKLLIRTVLFLAILFVMLYVGMTNTRSIPFYCPHLWDKPVEQPAALVYFVVFAAGVFGGTLLHMGGKGGGSKGSKSGKDK